MFSCLMSSCVYIYIYTTIGKFLVACKTFNSSMVLSDY